MVSTSSPTQTWKTVFIESIDIGTTLQQIFHDLGVSLIGGPHQRSELSLEMIDQRVAVVGRRDLRNRSARSERHARWEDELFPDFHSEKRSAAPSSCPTASVSSSEIGSSLTYDILGIDIGFRFEKSLDTLEMIASDC